MSIGKLAFGDTIGIVNPSSVANPETRAVELRTLERLGFRVKMGANVYADTWGFVASDVERAGDFNAMVRDPEVKMVLFSGGEGSNELLPLIDYDTMRQSPKLYCSYSDGTSILNAIHAKTGMVVYYGQSPGVYGDLRQYDWSQFEAHFLREHPGAYQKNSEWTALFPGCGEGYLIGGYTRNFALLQRSEYLTDHTGRQHILFLEDHEHFSEVGEVNVYLAHIGQSPLMSSVKGLLFGHYSAPQNAHLLQTLERFGKKHGIPVVYCDDFGHGTNHAILPIGARVRLDADNRRMDFL